MSPSPNTARVLAVLGTAWSLLILAGTVALMWGFIVDYHSCADFGHQTITSPIVTGWMLSVPGFLLFALADRLRADGTWRDVSRFLTVGVIASVVLIVIGVVAPKPGPPCMVRRLGLRSRLSNLATMQEAFKADSNRYSLSLDAIGASPDQYNSGYIRTTIAWADSASWGAYIVYTDSTSPRHVVRWMCAAFSDNDSVSRPVEGIGPLRNGCWDPKR